MKWRSRFCAAALSLVAVTAHAQPSAQSMAEALTKGTPTLDARYRYEFVDQDGLARDAHASTLRTRIGFTTLPYEGLSAGIGFESITNIGAERYNNGYNGNTRYPQVLDAQDTALDTLFLRYAAPLKTNITLGRQGITLDNQRFVGAAEWRQHGQNFDAIAIESQPFDKTTLFYAYLNQVNRVTGPDSPTGTYESDSHLINASYALDPALKVTGYTYLLDFEEAASSSSQTYGARLTGAHALGQDTQLLYTAEAATQSDYGRNTSGVTSRYYILEPGLRWHGWTGKLGYETLGGNGQAAFQTPLASVHGFNGWADKFATTPVNGLRDTYASVNYTVKDSSHAWVNGTQLALAYHDYGADHTSSHYGTEWNGQIVQTFEKHYTVGAKYADYRADGLLTDTQKAILWLGVKF